LIQQHAVALHRIQHRHHRHFDVGIDVFQFFVVRDAREQGLMQLQRDVGVFRSVFTGAFDGYLLETDAFGTLTCDIIITYCF
jgi:hypothetical protein